MKSKYDEMADDYIERTRNGFYNHYMEFPAMKKLFPDVNYENKKVLDLGCGFGRYSKHFISKGAKVWGIDASKELIKTAQAENPEAEFTCGNISNLTYSDSYFDFVVSGLVLDYISKKDLQKTLDGVYRVLKKNGSFIFSYPNPITFSSNKKQKDGSYLIQDYFKEGKREMTFFSKHQVPYHYKTMETIMNSIVDAGFRITGYSDAKPSIAAKKKFPDKYEKYTNIPLFMVFQLQK
jgi:ubiquinone/menaquinone biosynthesis C-methylase UbiE